VIERLLEDWLDSASERSYQTVFVQMLSAQGYRVLHSTRHCALEYGKDIIAIAPDGVPCAFQLKGNPGGRLGLSEFRAKVQDQLVQLISQPIVYPGLAEGVPHRSFLVSNGYFDEEVQRAVDDLNRGSYLSTVDLVGRGQLFDWARTLGSSLWPSELRNVRDFLEVFLHDGRDLMPLHRLAPVLEEILALRSTDTPLSRTELQRRIPSAALLTGIVTHHFSAEANHFAIASAWCLFAISTIASSERASTPLDGQSRESLCAALDAIKDTLVALWNEVCERPNLVEGNALADPEVYGWRYTLLSGLLSVLWFFPGDTDEDTERRQSISTWLKHRHEHLLLWGEGAVPSILALLLFLARSDATSRPDHDLADLFKSVVFANQQGSKRSLPDPYYEFESIGRLKFGLQASEESESLRDETFAGSSYTAELLLHLLAKSLVKKPCRNFWSEFNRLSHKQFIPSAPWQYGRIHCDEGVEETREYPMEYRWEDLLKDARVESCEYVPQELQNRPHLLMFWVIIAPHRLTSDVGRLLAARLRK